MRQVYRTLYHTRYRKPHTAPSPPLSPGTDLVTLSFLPTLTTGHTNAETYTIQRKLEDLSIRSVDPTRSVQAGSLLT